MKWYAKRFILIIWNIKWHQPFAYFMQRSDGYMRIFEAQYVQQLFWSLNCTAGICHNRTSREPSLEQPLNTHFRRPPLPRSRPLPPPNYERGRQQRRHHRDGQRRRPQGQHHQPLGQRGFIRGRRRGGGRGVQPRGCGGSQCRLWGGRMRGEYQEQGCETIDSR